jgi:hypothetical protein
VTEIHTRIIEERSVKIERIGPAVIGTCVVAMLCSAPVLAKRPPTDTRQETIKIKVNNPRGANASLEATNSKTEFGCKAANNPEKGCVTVELNYAADMVFRLQGNPKCLDDKEWELTGVDLAGYSETGLIPKANVKWDEQINTKAANDFNANSNTGEVHITVLNKSNIRIHNSNEYEYTIWYRVKASCNGKDIYLDPEVKNRGRN